MVGFGQFLTHFQRIVNRNSGTDIRIPIDDDLDELAITIRRKCETLPPMSCRRCIYRIPRNLRIINEHSYTPNLISIGPFHRGDARFQAMEEQKLRYLQRFVERNRSRNMEDYLRAAMKWEKEARDCYLEPINISSIEFTEMLVLDGCFIIEFFLRWIDGDDDSADYIFHSPVLSLAILRDLTLLENQVPFFILEILYDMAFAGIENAPSFLKLTCECMIEHSKLPEYFKKTKTLHLVDFLRTYYLPPEANDMYEDWDFPVRVSKLCESGVTLQIGEGDRLLNIKFEKGVLYIPKLELVDDTESLLRNLVAFEQCHYPRETFVVDYLLFLDSLICDMKDFEVLVDHGIILNCSGDNENVYRLFSNISKGVVYSRTTFYYADVCKRLNEYCRTPWSRWTATLRQDYFSNRWSKIYTIAVNNKKRISAIVALVVLILTAIQTYCDVLQL